MDEATLAAFDQRLQQMQAALDAEEAASAGARAVVPLDQQAVGRLSRIDALQAQAMARAQSARRAVMARRIDAARARVADGTFGACESCGEDIPPRRLDLDPTLPTCVSCASG